MVKIGLEDHRSGIFGPTALVGRLYPQQLDEQLMEAVETISKSLIFADADDLGIWNWVHSERPLWRIASLGFGQIPSLITDRFHGQTIRPIFAAPTPQQVDLEIRSRTFGTDTWRCVGRNSDLHHPTDT